MENLQKFAENCRFCLIQTDNFERTTLNDSIENNFKELTNCSLIKFQQFSKFSCQKCLKKLEMCLKIREEFIENQKKLLDLYEKSKTEEFSRTTTKSQDPADSFDKILADFLEVDLIDQIKEEAKDDLNSNQIFVKKETESFLDENRTRTGRLHKCDSCSASFKTVNLLTAHKETYHILIEPKSELDSDEYEIMDVIWENSKTLQSHATSNLEESPTAKNSKDTVKPMSKCEYCNKIVTTVFLPYHIRHTHKRKYRYFCDCCNKGFFEKFRIREHVKIHFNIKDFPCDQCNSAFFTRCGLVSHQKLVHQGIPRSIHKKFVCECGKAFRQKAYLVAHIATHSFDKPFQCDFKDCGKRFSCQANLTKHSTLVHREGKACNICSKVFKNLAAHMKTVHWAPEDAPKYTTCTTCGQMVLCSYLKTHILIHTNKNKFRCDLCGKGFATKRKISDHLKMHFKIVDHRCDICSLGFYTRTGLTNHIKQKHLGMKIKRKIRTCEYCGESFDIKNKYDNHIKSKHTGERNFKCDIEDCNRTFVSQLMLTSHKKGFHAEKVQCPICFKMVKLLARHKRYVHEQVEVIEIPCSYNQDGTTCNKKFQTKTAMNAHIDSFHKGLRKYRCPECDICYFKAKDLRHHVRTKHEKIKIKCELCPTLVTRKDYYARHIKLHHKELDDETRNALLHKIRETRLEKLILCTT